jgi:hypothetical protein
MATQRRNSGSPYGFRTKRSWLRCDFHVANGPDPPQDPHASLKTSFFGATVQARPRVSLLTP